MLSILIADDAPSVRKLLRLILEPAHLVIEAGDGDQALRQLVDHRPDVAILDVTMPARTGLDVCRQIRQDPRLAGTGVIVITANGTPTDRAAALAAGADHFLPKPFSPASIVRLVEEVRSARCIVRTDDGAGV
jgi:two-component system phosphate regulon response regulator PhoB